ncbi:MAG: SGNH/GDSL hydrolase family protein [Acidobacteriota bacterium]
MTKRWKLRLASVLFALVAATLIFEIGLRAAGISSPNLVMPDEYRGFSPRPGAEGWWRKEGEAYIKINSDGLRDRERSKEKPANTFRVAVLGDSMMEALQVPLEETASAIMEQRLQECGTLSGRKVEVINFGVSSYGTAQELLTLRHKVWDYSPDLVLLAFTTSNDIKDNSRALAQDPDLRAYFIYQDGKLVPDMSFLESDRFRRQQSFVGKFLFWLKDHSRIVQAVNSMRSALRARREANDQKSVDAYNFVYREPGDPVWNEAWRVTEGTVVMMRDEVEKKGASFMVATLSNDWQVHPDPSVRQQFARGLGVAELFYPDQRIKALGEREGFAVVNLARGFREYAERSKVPLHGFGHQIGFGHWNLEGNRLTGEALSKAICELIEKQTTKSPASLSRSY